MKPNYSIIVQDLTADQARRLINELDGGDFFVGASMSARNEKVEPIGKFVPAPTAAPVAEQPAAPVVAVSQNPTTKLPDDIDATGLPWDERIHASSKAKNKDGSWKSKRGVQPVTVTEVEAELRARAPVQQPSAPFAPVAQQPAPQPFTPPAPVAQAAAPVVPTRDFQGLMLRISQLFSTQQITPEYPGTIVQRVNEGFQISIATITDVAADPRYVEYAWQCLEVDGKAR